MTEKPSDEEKMDEVLRRMLATPPKPHVPTEKPKAGKRGRPKAS